MCVCVCVHILLKELNLTLIAHPLTSHFYLRRVSADEKTLHV